MTVTWKLRDGLKWSDGEPLTCDDFKYAYEWVMDPDNVGVITAGWEDITNFECASDTDMIWHFGKIYEGYLSLATAPLPRHYLDKIPVKDQVNGAGFRPDEVASLPVSGPFKFESVTPQAELRLARNDNYVNPRTGKPANLDGIVFKWYGDPDSMIAGFRNGEIDVAYDLQDSDLPKVQDLGDQVSAVPALLYEFLRPNWATDPVRYGQGRSAAARATRRSRTVARAARRLTRPFARPSPTRSTRTRSTRGSSAATPRSRTRTSARRPGSTRTRPRRRSTPRRPSRSWPTVAGRTRMATASSRRTGPRPRSSSAPPPARSARTPSR